VAPSRDLKLRALGYRLTPQRQLVWDVVRGSKRHLSAEAICASVYRTLTLLERLGLVRSAYLGSGPAQFELAEPEEHHHTICRSCGAIMHLEDEFLQAMRAHLKESHGFLAEKVQLAVLGRCERCAPGAGRRPARARAGAHR
jgi:Fur family ferric uptake transcriptional regulator